MYTPTKKRYSTGIVPLQSPPFSLPVVMTDADGPGSGTMELGWYSIAFRVNQQFPSALKVVLTSNGYTVETSLEPGYVVRDGKLLRLRNYPQNNGPLVYYFYVGTPAGAP